MSEKVINDFERNNKEQIEMLSQRIGEVKDITIAMGDFLKKEQKGNLKNTKTKM